MSKIQKRLALALAHAQRLDEMGHNGQLYPRGTFVSHGKELAIVMGSYAQMYDGGQDELKSYQILYLDKNGRADSELAWVEEDELKDVSSDTYSGIIIVEHYQIKQAKEEEDD